MKMGEKINLNTFFVMALTIMLFGCSTNSEKVIHVDSDASMGGDGTTWEKAYKYLQDALDDAVTGTEVWVATGKYKPTTEIGGSGDRYKSFQLKNGVGLYGGFTGKETKREQRDWQVNETILSGDLKNDDDGFNKNDEKHRKL